MRVLVTGATGYIGSALVRELTSAGHEVVGLARSDESAGRLEQAGARVARGSLDDLGSLQAAAAAADGVIHTAFTNVSPTTDFETVCRVDAEAIRALGRGLENTGGPLVITSGTGLASTPGRPVTEEDPGNWGPRVLGEEAALEVADRGVTVSIARLALSVHDGGADRAGFVPALIAIAREKGVSAYVGDGENLWSGVHRLDAVRLFRLALEKGTAGRRYHGVEDGGVAFRRIAEAIGSGIGVPTRSVTADEAAEHFGYLAPFIGIDNPASSAFTRAELGWQPEHSGLIADIVGGGYLETVAA